MRNSKDFKDRFLRWKNGELVYEAGRALPLYGDGKDLSLFLTNLWKRENMPGYLQKGGGYINGKYYPYKTLAGNIDVGPGFDTDEQSKEFVEKAYREGYTKEELDSMVIDTAQKELPYFYDRLRWEGRDPETVPDGIYNGLLDMYWLIKNGLYGYDNLWKAIADNDYKTMQKESITHYEPKNGIYPKGAIIKNGKILDTGRWNFRKSEYFKEYLQPLIKPLSFEDAVTNYKYPEKLMSYKEYSDVMKNVAKQNYKMWGFKTQRQAFNSAMTDDTYDYRGYYTKYPKGKGNAKDHWTDEFKTSKHPTFSVESRYAGKISKYNPTGTIGGFWIGDRFVDGKPLKNGEILMRPNM